MRHILTIGWITAALLIGWVGYGFLQTQRTAETYRRQLNDLQTDYTQLRDAYNDAVRKTAVTELLVKNGSLAVVIRTAQGEQKRIDTPFDPQREIYVDYVVIDGRLWIRRLFDADTPPDEALVIDPLIEKIDWSDPRYVVGKTVYRSLDNGCWIVTVTGNGSLGLAKRTDNDPSPLTPPPPIQQHKPLDS